MPAWTNLYLNQACGDTSAFRTAGGGRKQYDGRNKGHVVYRFLICRGACGTVGPSVDSWAQLTWLPLSEMGRLTTAGAPEAIAIDSSYMNYKEDTWRH